MFSRRVTKSYSESINLVLNIVIRIVIYINTLLIYTNTDSIFLKIESIKEKFHYAFSSYFQTRGSLSFITASN